jgi:hypothetical protein
MTKATQHKIILILLTFVFSAAYSNDIFHAKIYSEGDENKPIYTHMNTIEQKGDSTFIDHFYYTMEGELYIEDKVILVNNEPYYNSVEFFQIGVFSSLERKGDKVELNLIDNGKEKNVTRHLKLPLVFAPNQQMALRGYLDKLKKGESATFHIFATEVLRLVKMKVFMIKDSKYEREGCIVLQMNPKSKFIDWFVDEVFFVVDSNTGHIMEMHGFSTLRQKINDEWKFRDMDFYYSYE